MVKRLIYLLLIAFPLALAGQNLNPETDEIYREGEVAVIHLTMDPADSAFLLDDANIDSDVYLPAGFQFANSLMDTTLGFNVGIRLRGNTSRGQPKRSFKIKFKEFDGSKFYGYKKFNLKAENNDPSMVRELLSLQTFRNANVPATRTHHTEVYINGGFMGLYLNVEQLDDEFVKARFGNDTGNLYKCAWGATLEDDGQIYDDGIYEIKTNEDENDRSILAHFVDVLNNTSDENFQEEIEKVFDVQPFIRYLAVETLIGHWDGYSYNQNNFYLYENPDDGLIKFMPYDVDNTFGLDWLGEDWGTRDVLNWPIENQPRPLTKRILAVDTYFQTYRNELHNLLATYFSESALFPQYDAFKSMLADLISRDTYFQLTFGFTYQDFLDSYDLAIGGDYNQLPYGLKQYVTTRSETATEILGIEDGLKSSFDVYPNPSNGYSVTFACPKGVTIKTINLVDLNGKELGVACKNESNRYQLEFDSRLPKGFYILQLNGEAHKLIVR